jgi:MEKHLA domain
MMEIWEDSAIIERSELLLDSYERLLGRSLFPPYPTARERSQDLFQAPFVVVSHGTETNPIFNYGNRTALDLWEVTWEEFLHLPSRATVGEDILGADERQKMLDGVRERGYIEGYRGIRVSKTGRRFLIENVTVWNVIDPDGIYRGQAATYANWRFLG